MNLRIIYCTVFRQSTLSMTFYFFYFESQWWHSKADFCSCVTAVYVLAVAWTQKTEFLRSNKIVGMSSDLSAFRLNKTLSATMCVLAVGFASFEYTLQLISCFAVGPLSAKNNLHDNQRRRSSGEYKVLVAQFT